jgi:hypothetical protein
LHGSGGNRTEPAPSLYLSDAGGLRAATLDHTVQGMNGNGGLRRATLVRPRAQSIPDHSFKPTESWLHEDTTSVPGGLQPTHASTLGNALEMLIALCGCARCDGPQRRR